MLLTYDLDKDKIVPSLGSRRTTELYLKRGDVRTVQVQFIRNLQQVNLDEGTTFKFGAKAAGNPESSYLIFSDNDIWSGPADGVYEFTIDLTLPALAVFLKDKGQQPVLLDAEIERSFDGEVISSETFSIQVSDDINRGSETLPESGDVRRGVVSIDPDASSVDITFSTPFDAVPTIVEVQTRKPSSSADNLFAGVDDSSITAEGFTAHLSAAAPASGYKLQYRAEA